MGRSSSPSLPRRRLRNSAMKNVKRHHVLFVDWHIASMVLKSRKHVICIVVGTDADPGALGCDRDAGTSHSLAEVHGLTGFAREADNAHTLAKLTDVEEVDGVTVSVGEVDSWVKLSEALDELSGSLHDP